MPIEVFNRFEHKYLIDKHAYERAVEVMDAHMDADPYNKDKKPYTIANIYYDTDDDYLVRKSLSKPMYKEKLRLRAYGVPSADAKVFLEIKKKFNGIVNKRRSDLFLENGDYGKLLLPHGMYLMEIKTSTAKPLWLSGMLTELNLKRSSFSKYGTEFKNHVCGARAV